MTSTRLTPLLCSAILAAVAVAAPSPGSIGSDIQVLLHNDLYGNASARRDSVLVLSKPQTQASAASACSTLGETLWSPPSNLNTDNFLPYLAYQAGASSTQPSAPGWPSWLSWGTSKSKRSYPPGSVHGNPSWGHGPPAWGPPHGPPSHGPPGGPPAGQQLYYIAGNQGNGQCQAITTSAQVVAVNCNAVLPALCSNSAPLSGIAPWTMNATPIAVADTSARFQTSVKSGAATFTGFRDKIGYRFLGINYADFAQRFDYSAVTNATGEISALTTGPICWQINGITYKTDGTEHCLNLNVFTNYLPNGNANGTALKPVFMWIHGGGLTSGFGSDPTWDGGNLASRGDIVVVTINYRLGTFGWLPLPNNTAVHGNMGFGDQVNALKWIQQNIASFGGDPNRVTIGGQSSGGVSVQAHVRSPASAGLFSAAIQHSAGYSTYSTIPQAVARQTIPILNLTGCTGADQAAELACLRAYDAASLVNLPTVANSIVVDGEYFTTTALTFNSSSFVNKVPYMMGNMRDDGTPFIRFIQTTNLTYSLSQNNQAVSTVIGNPGAFPIPMSGNATYDVFNASSIVATDTFARCGTQELAYAGAATNTFPEVYYYENNRSYQIPYWPLPPLTALCDAPRDAAHPAGDPNKEYFKCHSGDLTTTFSTWRRWGLPERDANDTPYEQMILDYWTAFVRNHDPNPDLAYLAARGYTNTTQEVTSQGPWLTVSASNPTGRILEWPSVQAPFSHTQQCGLLGTATNSLVPAT